MSFSDHKITQFTHKIADLPDQSNMPADELKTRFDSSPEELRQSVNGICDDADRLEERVSGIIAETFGDTIDKSMLSTELAAELDAKVVKSDLYYGFYTGDGAFPRTITLGFAPRLVFVMRADGMTGTTLYTYQFLAAPVEQPTETDYCLLTQNGFQLRNEGNRCMMNASDVRYIYVAFK